MGRKAVIDIGSLKVKFLIAEDYPVFKQLYKDTRLTLLGKGLGEGGHKILESSLKDTIEVINEFKVVGKEKNVEEYLVIATEGLRKAKNLDDVLGEFRSKAGVTPRIISQEEEARIYFRAVAGYFKKDQEIVVVDMGGGSIQVMRGKAGELKEIHFLPLGVYYLQQKFVTDSSDEGKPTDEEIERLKNYIQGVIASSGITPKLKLPLVYGASNILDLFQFIKIKLYRSHFALRRHPFETKPEELERFLKKVKDLSHRQREKRYPFEPRYMLGIQMAFYNAIYLARHLGTRTIIPSNVSIAEGYIMEGLRPDPSR
jgi:exopolyphosphatase/guanosine-5'-triphosphate,3'-diphosphate pyrophosphatase